MTSKEIENLSSLEINQWKSTISSAHMRIDEMVRYLKKINKVLEKDFELLNSEQESGETKLRDNRETAMLNMMLSGMRETIFNLSYLYGDR